MLQLNAQTKVRLSKKTYITSNFEVVTKYSYDSLGKIREIQQTQNGKAFYTIYNFLFNEKGLLTSYIKTPNTKTFKEQIIITYDNNNRVSTYKVSKSTTATLSTNLVYEYNGDTLIIATPNNKALVKQYIFNNENIIRYHEKRIIGQPITKTYLNYDVFQNPLTTVGGFVDETPISKNNCTYITNTSTGDIMKNLIYEKIPISQHVTGGAKIPSLYKNGLLLQEVETRLDKATKKQVVISTTTYEYNKL
jgi:hypothetical protein